MTWTHQATGYDRVLLWQACFFAGRCAAVGRYWADHICMSTRDGVDWDRTKLEVKPAGTRMECIGVAEDRLLGVRHMDGGIPHLIASADGIHWDEPQPMWKEQYAIRHDAFVRRMVHGNGLTVAVGDYGMRLVSTDLKTWKATPNAKAKETVIDVAYGNGVFVGGGLHGLRMRSEDGLKWTHITPGEEGEHINSMVFDGTRFYGIGQGATYVSTDGIAWERIPNDRAPTTAAYGGGVFVGSVWPGRMLHSTDAVRWKEGQQLPHHVLGLNHGELGTA
ncbi:WD40/YVTN/BNR-like repeat-containing protein [Planctomicrobium sp. SH661]|uniref:WD40/YVTN/BNR-like repeat-containing protein n=1 Tax=Planctomicrobium sp. SH661 TaxID=3448124 RepID=UPI003F5C76EF